MRRKRNCKLLQNAPSRPRNHQTRFKRKWKVCFFFFLTMCLWSRRIEYELELRFAQIGYEIVGALENIKILIFIWQGLRTFVID